MQAASCCSDRPAQLLHKGLLDNAGLPLATACYLLLLSQTEAVLLPLGGVLVQ